MAVKKRIKATRQKRSINWIVKVTIMTFFLAILMGALSENVLRRVALLPALIVLLMIIFIGVTFDTIGIAVTAAKENPFHSMAAQNIPKGKYCVRLVRNAGQVSNFCNDVIGDISGIISGSATAIILVQIMAFNLPFFTLTSLSVLFGGIVAALTVGGKAYGKKLALSRWKDIVAFVGQVLYVLESRFNIRLLKDE